jgi:hypothetical protein
MAPPGKHGHGIVFYVHTDKKTLCLKAGLLSFSLPSIFISFDSHV